MRSAFIAPRCLHADGVLVVVVLAAWAGVAAAAVQSPSRVGFIDVVKRVEEDHPIGGHSDRSHWQRFVFVLCVHRDAVRFDFGIDRQLPNRTLFLDKRWVAVEHPPAVGERGGWMVR